MLLENITLVIIVFIVMYGLVLKTNKTSGSGLGCGKGRIGRGGRLRIKLMKMSGHPQMVR